MALTNCSVLIGGDLVRNCDNPVVRGLEYVAGIANREDVDIAATLATKVAGMKNTYANLVLKSGKQMYKASDIVDLDTTKTDGSFTNRFQQVVTGVLLDDGVAVSELVEALGNRQSEFVMIIKHKFVDHSRAVAAGSSAFQIIGLEVGLTSVGQEIKNLKSDENTMGGWSFALGALEPHPRNYLFATTYAATETIFKGLLGEV